MLYRAGYQNIADKGWKLVVIQNNGIAMYHWISFCGSALTEFIEYFKSRSTSIYVAFLDASKAFDKISHWTL